MKTRLLITVFLYVNCFAFSQLPCPLQSGTIIMPKLTRYNHSDETINKISSENNQVFSLSKGIVVNVLTHSDNTKSMIIKSNENDFLIYSNLDKILFNVKDEIEKDQIIALAFPDENEYYVLQFQFWENAESKKVDLKCRDF